MTGWLLALILWLAFNASVLLFAWLSYRDDEADELNDWVCWEAEVARSAREAAMRQHPAGGRQ